MINAVYIHGRLTKDPERRQTNSGKTTCTFTVAVDGNAENTAFLPCVAWEKTAETICNYLSKGSEVIVHGRLSSRSYTDKDGNKRTAIEVVVANVDFCGSRGGNSKPAVTAPSTPAPAQEAEWSFMDALGGDDTELPF